MYWDISINNLIVLVWNSCVADVHKNMFLYFHVTFHRLDCLHFFYSGAILINTLHIKKNKNSNEVNQNYTNILQAWSQCWSPVPARRKTRTTFLRTHTGAQMALTWSLREVNMTLVVIAGIRIVKVPLALSPIVMLVLLNVNIGNFQYSWLSKLLN